MSGPVAGVIMRSDDLRRAAPTLYRHMLFGWAEGGDAYPEHRPEPWPNILALRLPGERWEDVLIEGEAQEVDDALWAAASVGIDGPTLAAAIRNVTRVQEALFFLAAAGVR